LVKKKTLEKKLALFRVLKDEIGMLENLVITLEKEQIKNEMLFNTRGLVEGLRMANELSKGHEKLREDMEEVLLEKQEREARQQEINGLLKELTAGTEEENDEINDMLNQFEQNIHEEKIRAINEIPVKGIATSQGAQRQVPMVGKQQQQQQQKAKMEIEDDLDDLLKQAEQY